MLDGPEGSQSVRAIHAHERATMFVGDCRQAMANAIAPGSVHCVVTSPPYWGLRDYGIEPSDWEDGERCVFGLESTIEGYIAHTLEIFRGLDRVLRPDGVIWWNIGDTFARSGKGGNPVGSIHQKRDTSKGSLTVRNRVTRVPFADGNKLLIPHRVAIALQSAGWVVREDVVWDKPAPMPISVNGVRWVRCRVKVQSQTKGRQNGALYQGRSRDMSNGVYLGSAVYEDCPGCPKCELTGGYVLRRGRWRPTTSHETVLMVTRPGMYFCDAQAAAEQAVGGPPGNRRHKHADAYDGGDEKHRIKAGLCNVVATETRNPRSVWRASGTMYRLREDITEEQRKIVMQRIASVDCR